MSYTKSLIEEALSRLNFVEEYHVSEEDNSRINFTNTRNFDPRKRIKVRIWIIDNLYTVHILLGEEKIEKIIKNITKSNPVSIDVYSSRD
ncbi:hypothetical protein D3C71_1667600 [compost metagenome]